MQIALLFMVHHAPRSVWQESFDKCSLLAENHDHWQAPQA